MAYFTASGLAMRTGAALEQRTCIVCGTTRQASFRAYTYNHCVACYRDKKRKWSRDNRARFPRAAISAMQAWMRERIQAEKARRGWLLEAHGKLWRCPHSLKIPCDCTPPSRVAPEPCHRHRKAVQLEVHSRASGVSLWACETCWDEAIAYQFGLRKQWERRIGRPILVILPGTYWDRP